MKRILVCSALILGFYLPGSGLAAPDLKIEPLAKRISTGQTATLKVRLEWPEAEGPYEITSLEPKLENLTLETQNQEQETGATVTHTLTYEFRPLKIGAAIIYPFEVSYRKSETDPWIPLFIPEQNTKVVSNFPLRVLLIGIGVLGSLFVSGFAGFKIWRSVKTRQAAKSIPPPDPRQRIYAKAEESIATFTSSRAKEKLTHWSNQLRTVIMAYYDIPAKTASNTEVLSFLRSQGLPAGEWQEISRLFDQLNEFQFSRQDIPSYDLDRMQKTLLQYVKGKIIIGNSQS